MKTVTLENSKTEGVYILRNVLLGYPSLYMPGKYYKGEYGAEVLIPKSNANTVDRLVELIKKIGQEYHGKVKPFDIPIKDGDNQITIKGLPNPAPKPHKFDMFWFTARNRVKPDLNDLTGDNDFYHGCLCDIWFTIRGYTSKEYGGQFIGFNLIAVQKKVGGEALPLGPVYDVKGEFDSISENPTFINKFE